MKKILFSFWLFLSAINLIAQDDDEIDSSQDRIKVEAAVVHWADSVFYAHSNYKFENFRAEYSDDYYIAVMRSRAYKERVTDLEKEKAAGRYKGTEEAYQKEHEELNTAWLNAQKTADNFVNRADYYLIHFWSNIQTTDGITVYYEHIIKLDNSYRVIEATVNSAIGKKDENTQILYKKDVKGNGTNSSKTLPPKEATTSDKIAPVNNSDATSNPGNSENKTENPAPESGTSKKDKKKKKKK